MKTARNILHFLFSFSAKAKGLKANSACFLFTANNRAFISYAPYCCYGAVFIVAIH